jgi:hypothetical protein
VVCILAHTADFPSGRSAMYFFIDDTQVGTFFQEPFGTTDISYNTLVFSYKNISPGEHTLWIQSYGGAQKSFIALDYVSE